MTNPIIVATLAYFVLVFLAFLFYKKIPFRIPRWATLPALLPLVAGMVFSIWHLNSLREVNEPVWSVGDRAITWQKGVPLKVLVSTSIPTGVAMRALEAWNKDCVLVEMTNGADWDIQIMRGTEFTHISKVKIEENWAGVTFKSSLSPRVYILLLDVNGVLMDDNYEYLVLTHEIGHALGLAHDPETSSIMYKSTKGITSGTLPKPTKKDLKALKERYCKIN